MTVTGTDTEGGPSAQAAPGETAAGSGSAVSLLTGAVASDNCVQCGATLAPDQRYCVECGTRRGTARFALEHPAPAPAAADPTPEGRGASWSTATIVGAIVALLLAVAVGLLIGHWTSDTSRVRVVLSGATAGTTSSGSSTSGKSGSTAGKGGSSSGSGSSASSSSNVKPGGSCTAGTPGCQNGKETGNFFGG